MTTGTDAPVPEDTRRARARARVTAGRDQALDWVERRRGNNAGVDLAVLAYERDRDAFASVLGSAIALRLFLFFVAVVVTVVSALNVFGRGVIEDAVDEAGLADSVTDQVQSAVATAHGGRIVLLVSGIFGLLWAGRSLASVLVAASAGSWRLPGRTATATIRIAASVTGLVFALVLVTAILNRVRDSSGVAVATTSLFVTALVFAGIWFAVALTLPRPTPDPGAVLPGALLLGAGLALLQWFMQFYLPGEIARSSEVMGGIGVTVATLGYLFFVGRLVAASFVLNAVMWERVGSISTIVFGLPVLRGIPRRWPAVGKFFDLDHHGGEGSAP